MPSLGRSGSPGITRWWERIGDIGGNRCREPSAGRVLCAVGASLRRRLANSCVDVKGGSNFRGRRPSPFACTTSEGDPDRAGFEQILPPQHEALGAACHQISPLTC